MTELELERLLSPENFERDKLIKNRSHIFVVDKKSDNGIKSVTTDSYQFQNYDAFSLRKYASQCWFLSLGGKLVSYGSYDHVTEVIRVILEKLPWCHNSETSMIYFLTSPDQENLRTQIVNLRQIDHSPKV